MYYNIEYLRKIFYQILKRRYLNLFDKQLFIKNVAKS